MDIMIIRLILIALFCFAMTAKAVEVQNLYEASLSVSDKSRATRAQASQQALLKVLQKLTGKADDFSHPSIQASLKRISDYMLRYEYYDRQGVTKIKVEFEPGKVEDLVREAGLPLWGNRRPMVAIWMVIEDNFRREFVTQESYPQLERLIYDTADEWGVPVVVPLMDLEDRSNVSIAEVWGNFSNEVEEASLRYEAERVITARLFQPPHTNSWQLDWRYTDAEYFEPEQYVGDKQQVIIDMVNQLSSTLAQKYVIDPNLTLEAHRTEIVVEQLQSFTDVEMAKRRLLSMSTVVDVDVIYRAKTAVKFAIEHTSSASDLRKTIALEQSFKAYEDPRAYYQIADDNNLKYNWVGK
ncbi:DUF2066 domain-containing protein [Pseudoalteromonas sp. S2755]|uniref:DUF2066 domain-containing protein n=1 Tax=Pseudoalteromonas sp. S2755 TaxID=2066523 RepID=UPI00110A2CE1|nr:DUF2066 domain-containing protein [Pseudoalteromonas sp. S2755]TMN39885.1 DUF2066 domain-containing protein [Pseudoalteromonas sp. S2755]